MFDWLFGKKKPGTDLVIAPEVVRVQEEIVAGPTILHMRARPHCYPAVFWEAEVFYDAWGEPYATGDWTDPQQKIDRRSLTKLAPNGQTHATGRTEWLHKSGPPVQFPPEKWRNRFHPEGWHPE